MFSIYKINFHLNFSLHRHFFKRNSTNRNISARVSCQFMISWNRTEYMQTWKCILGNEVSTCISPSSILVSCPAPILCLSSSPLLFLVYRIPPFDLPLLQRRPFPGIPRASLSPDLDRPFIFPPKLVSLPRCVPARASMEWWPGPPFAASLGQWHYHTLRKAGHHEKQLWCIY